MDREIEAASLQEHGHAAPTMILQQSNGGVLRAAEFAALTSRAVTDNARALVDKVHELVIAAGARKRQRGARKALAFKRAVGGFIGDLMRAAGREVPWVFRSVSQRHFTGDVVSHRHFEALRSALKSLKFIEEAKAVQFWSPFGVGRGWAKRFRATPRLIEMAGECGVPVTEVRDHFIKELPKNPLLQRGGSTREPGRRKMPGKPMKIDYTPTVQAMEQTIVDLNTFLDHFTIGGGAHRGYVRVFNVGDHPAFAWNLGGRLYSQGQDSYQSLSSDERLKMTIDGEPVCELDIRASYLTIFQARHGRPLDFAAHADPYVLPDLGEKAREAVKTFIAATFGRGEFPTLWSREMADRHRERTGGELRKHHPLSIIRAAVGEAYPLLAALRSSEERPPIWAELMFLESEALLRTMLALKGEGVPSLSVHDSLIVQKSRERLASSLLENNYTAITSAAPHITKKAHTVGD
jgi:hypothetical protein